MKESRLEKFDRMVIGWTGRASDIAARLALAIVFFWFGALKLLGTSPANPLVESLLRETIPFLTFAQFIVFFAMLEMAIGIVFLVSGFERLAIALLIPHMATTFLPLIFLREITWAGFMTPTLEGQYIIKNLLIIALAIGIAARLRPWSSAPGESGREGNGGAA